MLPGLALPSLAFFGVKKMLTLRDISNDNLVRMKLPICRQGRRLGRGHILAVPVRTRVGKGRETYRETMEQGPSITGIDAVPVRVSGSKDFKISEGKTRTHTSVIVRIQTEDETLEGIGEVVCAPPGKPEELPEEILGAIRTVVAPALAGQPAGNRAKCAKIVDSVLKGRPWTKAGLSNAFFDLQGKLLGASATDILGGRLNDRIPVMGTVLGIDDPDKMAALAAATVAEGFRAVKVKIGETVDRDVARVAAVRDAVGPDIQVRVDANDHYHPADAIRLIRAIERFNVEHVEQPISRRDLLGMAEIRKAVGIPIMTDDMVATPQEAMTVIRLGAADRIKVKVTKHGLDGAKLITEMLAAAGMTAVLGHVFEMGLAAVAEMHLAAAVPNLAGPHEIGSMQPMGTSADIIRENLRGEPGFLTLPAGPGLGVTLDWSQIEEMRAAI